MHLFRQLYQNEVVIFASYTMIYLARGKLATNKKEGKTTSQVSPELQGGHRYAGYFLAMLMFGHVGATRFGSLWFLGDFASEYDYTFITYACGLFPFNIFQVCLMLLTWLVVGILCMEQGPPLSPCEESRLLGPNSLEVSKPWP